MKRWAEITKRMLGAALVMTGLLWTLFGFMVSGYFIFFSTFERAASFYGSAFYPGPVTITLGGLLLGVAAGGLWTAREEAVDSAKIQYGIEVILRFVLAFAFFHYGFSKVFGGQFYEPLYQWLETPAGELSGFELTWTYFGSSYGLALFLAAAEIVPAALLLSRRTQTLGALLYAGVAANIVVIDVAHGITFEPLYVASALLVMALYLLMSDGRRLVRFSTNRKAEPRRLPEIPFRSSRKGRLTKYGLVLVIVGLPLLMNWQAARKHPPKVTELTGVWSVQDVQPLSPEADRNQAETWTKIIFEKHLGGRNGALFVDGEGRRMVSIDLDTLRTTVTIRTWTDAGAPPAFSGSYSLESEERAHLVGRAYGDSVRLTLEKEWGPGSEPE